MDSSVDMCIKYEFLTKGERRAHLVGHPEGVVLIRLSNRTVDKTKYEK
jgi:hypothetical protein